MYCTRGISECFPLHVLRKPGLRGIGVADRLRIFACSMLKSSHSRLAFPSLDWHMCNGVCVALNTPTDIVLGCIGYQKNY